MVAHGFELPDGFGACFFGVEPGEVVRSGVEVGGIGGGMFQIAMSMARWTATFALSGPRRLAIRRYLAAR